MSGKPDSNAINERPAGDPGNQTGLSKSEQERAAGEVGSPPADVPADNVDEKAVPVEDAPDEAIASDDARKSHSPGESDAPREDTGPALIEDDEPADEDINPEEPEPEEQDASDESSLSGDDQPGDLEVSSGESDDDTLTFDSSDGDDSNVLDGDSSNTGEIHFGEAAEGEDGNADLIIDAADDAGPQLSAGHGEPDDDNVVFSFDDSDSDSGSGDLVFSSADESDQNADHELTGSDTEFSSASGGANEGQLSPGNDNDLVLSSGGSDDGNVIDLSGSSEGDGGSSITGGDEPNEGEIFLTPEPAEGRVDGDEISSGGGAELSASSGSDDEGNVLTFDSGDGEDQLPFGGDDANNVGNLPAPEDQEPAIADSEEGDESQSGEFSDPDPEGSDAGDDSQDEKGDEPIDFSPSPEVERAAADDDATAVEEKPAEEPERLDDTASIFDPMDIFGESDDQREIFDHRDDDEEEKLSDDDLDEIF